MRRSSPRTAAGYSRMISRITIRMTSATVPMPMYTIHLLSVRMG
jgi:hypothetical protein